MNPVNALRHWLTMLVLGASGGIIFLLPFLRESLYRPLSEALDINNAEFGMLMSVFGVTSMLFYLPGGWLADRYSPRLLISVALLITGCLGLYFSTYPGFAVSLAIHGLWGITITLLFWASMLRVARAWAPPNEQGRAFGTLETTRGVTEVLVNSATVGVFVWLGSSAESLSVAIVNLSSACIVLAIAAWFVIDNGIDDDEDRQTIRLADVGRVLRLPAVWLIAIVILSAYSAYWTSFYFTPYAGDVFLMSVGVAGAVSVGRMWLKPIAAVVAGLIADRLGIARSVMGLFVILILSFLVFAAMPGDAGIFPFVLVNIAIAAIAIFALRGIYFALLEEGGIPIAVTGTAAGIVSVIGYTPDIYMPYLGGKLLDSFPAVVAYRYLFLVAVGFCTLGFVAAWMIHRRHSG